MKTIIISVLLTLTVVGLTAAAVTKINIQQLIGAGTGTFVLTSVNGVNQWSLPVTAVVPSFADGEVPTGTINGTNASFTLAHASAQTGNSLVLVRNGVVQQSGGNDYTLAGATVTFTTGSIPQTGDVVLAWYRY